MVSYRCMYQYISSDCVDATVYLIILLEHNSSIGLSFDREILHFYGTLIGHLMEPYSSFFEIESIASATMRYIHELRSFVEIYFELRTCSLSSASFYRYRGITYIEWLCTGTSDSIFRRGCHRYEYRAIS
jgi:hypothetical protein